MQRVSALLLLALSAALAHGDVLYVDGQAGNDSWDGRCPHWDGADCGPKQTVSAAIASATAGAEIVVAPGTYAECLKWDEQDLFLHSNDPADPLIVATTVLDGASQGTVVTLASGILSGFTIMRGYASYGDGGGGVTAEGNATVYRNVITNNVALGGDAGGMLVRERAAAIDNQVLGNIAADFGGGLTIDGSALAAGNVIHSNAGNPGGGICALGSSVVHGNYIVANSSDGSGGGVFAAGAASVIDNQVDGNDAFTDAGAIDARNGAEVRNNTMTGNDASLRRAAALMSDSARLLNNIIAFNKAADECAGVWGVGGAADYNCLFDNTCQGLEDCPQYGGGASPGPHDLAVDPLFESDGLHLSASSPCANAGYPGDFGQNETDIDGQPRVMAGRVDIGADELNGRPFVYGDMNCDGLRDARDIVLFFAALADPLQYQGSYPECPLANGDVNGDGLFDGGDIDAFFECLQS